MNRAVHNEMAKFAYDNIGKISDGQKTEFRSLARSFPSMVQINGLAAAVAFLFAKSNSEAHCELYEMIDKWTRRSLEKEDFTDSELSEGKRKNQSQQQYKSQMQASDTDLKKSLMDRILNLDSAEYRIYTNEVMNLCLWVKRFAEGMLSDEVKVKPEK